MLHHPNESDHQPPQYGILMHVHAILRSRLHGVVYLGSQQASVTAPVPHVKAHAAARWGFAAAAPFLSTSHSIRRRTEEGRGQIRSAILYLQVTALPLSHSTL